MQPTSSSCSSIVPPAGHGLGLKGNRGDYYNPSNSLLSDVLAPRGMGIPITLAIVHMAVARRCGLPVELINMPMHVVNRLPAQPGSGQADDIFIDVFNEGKLMQWEQLVDFATNIGVRQLSRARLAALAPSGVFQRMCANLIDIYSTHREHDKVKTMLDLVTTINPEAKEYLSQRSRMALAVKEFGDAARTVRELKALLMASEPDASKRHMVEAQLDQVEVKVEEMRAEHQSSCEVQKYRAPSLKFSVGDIIRHKRYHYRGLVYDWDQHCNVDEGWIQQMGVDALPGGRHQPFYRVLVDVRDRPFQNTYVAQCNLELLQPVATETAEVQHPDIGQYFEGLAPGRRRYTPNPYMVYRFPQDFATFAAHADLTASTAAAAAGGGGSSASCGSGVASSSGV